MRCGTPHSGTTLERPVTRCGRLRSSLSETETSISLRLSRSVPFAIPSARLARRDNWHGGILVQGRITLRFSCVRGGSPVGATDEARQLQAVVRPRLLCV